MIAAPSWPISESTNFVTIGRTDTVVTVEFEVDKSHVITVPGDYATIQGAITAANQGDTVIVGLRVSQPDWSGSVDVFKRFTFRHDADLVIGMQDCADRDDALSVARGT